MSLTRPQVLTSQKFLQLMELPNGPRVARLLKALADSEVMFDGWEITDFTISNASHTGTIIAAGDISLGTLINGAEITGDVRQIIHYLTPTD